MMGDDVLMDAEDERRKKGMLVAFSRFEVCALLLAATGGLTADRIAWDVVCVLALDEVSVRLGVERSGVRALSVEVGVGEDESLIGLSDEIDGEG